MRFGCGPLVVVCVVAIPATVLCVLPRSREVFWLVMRSDGFQTQKKQSWVSGQVRTERVLAEAITIDGRKEWEQKGKYQREWKRSQGVDLNEMRKEENNLRCALLNGSAWSTERKYMRRCKGTSGVFFGIEA